MLKSENVGAALAKEQLCEYENQTVEAFAAAYLLYAQFDSVFNFDSVTRQIFFSILATAHDCESGLFT